VIFKELSNQKIKELITEIEKLKAEKKVLNGQLSSKDELRV